MKKCVSSVKVSPSQIVLKVGRWFYGTYKEVTPSDATCKSVEWSSCCSNIAAVNPTLGYIYAVSPGTTKIYATAIDGSGKEDYLIVTVIEDSCCRTLMNTLTLNKNSLTVRKGETGTVSVCSYTPADTYDTGVHWYSSNPNIATVNNSQTAAIVNGVSEGHARLIAVANDGSGTYSYCDVYVSSPIIPVRSVIINEECSMSVYTGTRDTLEVTVYPNNATNRAVQWRSSNENIVTVDQNGNIYAKKAGNATITAVSVENNEIKDTCDITVKNRRVTGVTVSPSCQTMRVGDQIRLSAYLSPSNATNTTVRWSSDDTDIVTVESTTGCVTARNAGTATVTAITDDGNYTDSCEVTVLKQDTRPVVKVEEDDQDGYDFFKVTFPNSEGGLIWKSVGYNLSSENISIPQAARIRSNYNLPQNFSERQLALLYLFDPLGVQEYVKYYFLNHNDSDIELLEFKDRVYHQIFGEDPERFLIDDSGNRYSPNPSLPRDKVYTDSELVFGTHNIPDIAELIKFGTKLVLDLLGILLPQAKIVTWVARGATAADLAFFCGSIVDAFTSDVSNALQNYIEKEVDKDPVGLLMWPKKIFDILKDIKDGIENSIGVPDTNDLAIYNKISKQNLYNVKFKRGAQNMFIREILDLCSE